MLLKRKSIEETFVNKKKLKKGRANVYKTMHVCLGRQLQDAESILGDENADVLIDCFLPWCQEPSDDNFPEVVLPAGFGVRNCHGCKGKTSRKKCPPPKDFAFHMQALQILKDQQQSNGTNIMATFTSILPCHV